MAVEPGISAVKSVERPLAMLAQQILARSRHPAVRRLARRARAPAIRSRCRAENARCRDSSTTPASGKTSRFSCRDASLRDLRIEQFAIKLEIVVRHSFRGKIPRSLKGQLRPMRTLFTAVMKRWSTCGELIDRPAGHKNRRAVPQLAQARDVAQHERATADRCLQISRARRFVTCRQRVNRRVAEVARDRLWRLLPEK